MIDPPTPGSAAAITAREAEAWKAGAEAMRERVLRMATDRAMPSYDYRAILDLPIPPHPGTGSQT